MTRYINRIKVVDYMHNCFPVNSNTLEILGERYYSADPYNDDSPLEIINLHDWLLRLEKRAEERLRGAKWIKN
jgi:hypothetical protein